MTVSATTTSAGQRRSMPRGGFIKGRYYIAQQHAYGWAGKVWAGFSEVYAVGPVEVSPGVTQLGYNTFAEWLEAAREVVEAMGPWRPRALLPVLVSPLGVLLAVGGVVAVGVAVGDKD
jgi:hypothetical protein